MDDELELDDLVSRLWETKLAERRGTAYKPLLLALAIATMLSCGGRAGIGEECSTRGSVSECEQGAICDQDKSVVVCLKTCADQGECASTQDCNGVSGSNIKACHTK